ncbi:hypothetical protein [Deinococcus yavapaiensis]|uniref:DUF4157 domain-containing protein n=1 Tax=Deinococcus yavapaiensis KR-236 TaxID=694435 RepID=A0A318SAS8_9DEIO|nr:hypothetical protein [Deinococcus yavapaiensis]PYE53351.1 hypothetical protein DES52_109125 [Deinococcus yavapaiensis KR-236]
MRRLLAVLVLLAAHAFSAPAGGGETPRGLTVRYSDVGDKAYVPAVTRAWRSARSDLEALGLTLPPVTIRVAKDARDFARATGEAWFVAAVTSGATIHTQRLGALQVRGSLPLTIRHELFHVAQPKTLPRWLAEGLARIFAGQGAAATNAKTGLEHASNAELDRLLADRDERTLNAAYAEATRRAARLVHERGWRGALRWNRS